MSGCQRWSLDELQVLVPDARQPLGLTQASSRWGDPTLAQRQRERRAMILSLARTQIDEGYPEIDVRDLAERSQLCRQTIYNLVGGKDEILAAAVDEHYKAILSALDMPAAGAHVFDLMADVLWIMPMKNPCYIKALLRRYFQHGDSVHRVIRSRIQEACSNGMQRYLGQHSRSAVATNQLAEKMLALVAISSFDWMHERATLTELRDRLSSDFNFVLGNL